MSTHQVLQLMHAKGGAASCKMHPLLDSLNTQNIEEKRDAVVCCLSNYLGERQEDMFHDWQECEEYTDKTMKEIVEHNLSIVIGGKQVMEGWGNQRHAYCWDSYAINIEYPKELKNTFEAFQKLCFRK